MRKVVAKYGDSIAANLAISGAEIKLMSPEEYGVYLKAQEALYMATIRNLNAGK